MIKDGFWKFYEELNRNQIVKSVYDRFKETGRFDALKCIWKEGNEKHLELARFFLNQRGNNDIDPEGTYDQSNHPLRELTQAVGRSVRAGYLYTARLIPYFSFANREPTDMIVWAMVQQ